MSTQEQQFLIDNNLKDIVIGVEISHTGIVVDPKTIYVSQIMKAWAKLLVNNNIKIADQIDFLISQNDTETTLSLELLRH